MTRLGMIGFSPGNGHPFSFSAILNGYDSALVRGAGWAVIADYLDQRDPSEFGVGELRVTAAWSPDDAATEALASACHIETVATSVEELAESVDAVIVARDDHLEHRRIASVFLDRGIPTFVDKPLSLSPDDLAYFAPFVRSGTLMTTSGTRYSDALRRLIDAVGDSDIQRIDGVTPQPWDRYGIHLLEAVSVVAPLDEVEITARRRGDTTHVALFGAEGRSINLTALGGSSTHPIRLSITTSAGTVAEPLSDNFVMFRRLLIAFNDMLQTGRPPIDPATTESVVGVAAEVETVVTAT